MSKLPSPEKADVQFLRDWLTGTGDGDNFLREREKYTWDLPKNSSAHERKYLDKDLFTIRSGIEEQDIFSRLLSSSLLDAWSYLRWAFGFGNDRSTLLGQQKRRFSKSIDPDSGLLHYSEAGILRVNNIFISVLGAALPIVAIVVLWVIKTELRSNRSNGRLHRPVCSSLGDLHKRSETRNRSINSGVCTFPLP